MGIPKFLPGDDESAYRQTAALHHPFVRQGHWSAVCVCRRCFAAAGGNLDGRQVFKGKGVRLQASGNCTGWAMFYVIRHMYPSNFKMTTSTINVNTGCNYFSKDLYNLEELRTIIQNDSNTFKQTRSKYLLY